MATDVQSSEVVLQAAMNLIGKAQWNLNYLQFLERMDAPDDEYWDAKWRAFQQLNQLFGGSWDAHTLAKLVS